MPINYSDRLFEFAVALAQAGRIMTTRQLARHPDLSWRSDPIKQASQFLRLYPDSFERMPGPVGEPHRWRLTTKEKTKRGIKFRRISGYSMKADHWLGIADIWLSLTFYGGRPTVWKTEPESLFDVYCEWERRCLLIEYQRTPITEYRWKQKWINRVTWYKAQEWNGRPLVVLVDVTGQQDETVSLPKGVLRVKSIEELPKKIMRPPR